MIQGKKLTKISKFSLPKGSIQNFSLKNPWSFPEFAAKILSLRRVIP